LPPRPGDFVLGAKRVADATLRWQHALVTLFVAILAGGSGTRFWPASTRNVPKQLLPLAGGLPLVRETWERVRGLVPPERATLVTSARFADAIRALVPELPAANVLGEPVARNTAAACAVATRWAQARAPDAVVVTLPADHVISPASELREKLAAAAAHAASSGALVTLGLRPTFAATGFGWIHLAEEISRRDGHAIHRVASFVEKPDRARAEAWLAGGQHLWNLGLFAWRADAFLGELERHQPQIAACSQRALASMDEGYRDMPSISVDHGVLEHAKRVDCLPCTFAWDDLGSFAALPRHLPKDVHGNCAAPLDADAPLVALEAKDCIVWGESGRMTALLGVEDLIVVHANGATLVAHRSRAEDVKKLVEELHRRGLERFA
jgi:mannose-1-phosphate guanylyltransferase